MGSGRKTILTKELQEAICTAVAEVSYITVACESVGVSYQTVKSWIQKAQDHIKQAHLEDEECDELCNEKDVAFRSFLSNYKMAKANYLRDNVQEIRKHRGKNWMAAAWLNERAAPDMYGQRTAQTLSVSGTIKHQHSISIDQRQKVLKAAADSLTIDTSQEDDILDAEIVPEKG